MNLAIFVAIISPILFAFMNVFDKYVVSHKVKDSIGYAAVAGIVNVVLGIIVALFLSWNNVTSFDILFPIVAGIFSGGCYYFYFFIMKDSDASYLIGFAYLFPIVVAILSFIFLNERLSILSYVAIAFILLGVILLSIRAKKIKVSMLIIPLLFYIILLGFYEFSVKVSTTHVSFMQGLAITTAASGVAILLGLFNKKVRKGFKSEFKNIKLAFFSETFTLIAVFTLYFAMSKIPATMVSSIASTQPLAVIVLERIAHSYFGKITKDVRLLPKLGAIGLIVIGVIILSVINS